MSENKMSRTRYASLNILTSIIYRISNTVSNMILPPLIIAFFGSAINGLIASIRDLLKYAQLYGAGISASSMQAMYKPINNNDQLKITKMFNVVKETFNKSGILFSITVLVISGVYPLVVYRENIILSLTLIIIMGIAGAIELFFVGKFRTILTAHQRGYVIFISMTIAALINVLVSVLLLYLTKNILLVQLGGTLVYFLRVIIPYIYIKKKYRFLICTREKDYTVIKKRNDAIVHALMGTLTLSSQTIIIAIMISLNDASVYSIYNLVFYGLFSIISSLTISITSSFGSLVSQGNQDKIREVYSIYNFIFMTVLFIIFVTASLVFFEFLGMYIGSNTDTNYFNISLLILFFITNMLNSIRIPAITMINAVGHFKETKNGAILESIIAIFFQIFFTYILGIVGVLIGTIIALLYRSLQLMIYTNKNILKINRFSGFLKMVINFIVSFLILYYHYVSYDFSSIESWIGWILYSLKIIIIISLIFVSLNGFMNKKNIKKTFVYLKHIIRVK